MKKFGGILLVLALLAGAAWIIFGSRGDRLIAVKPLRGPVVQAVYATGTVEPTIMIPISPRISARLLALHADEGQEVKKDQVLAQLEDTDIQGRLSQAQAQADLAQKDYDRKAPLVKKGAVSKETLDQTQAALASARATLDQIRAEIGYLRLISPADGRIIRRDGEVGALLAAGQPVFYLSCCAPLRIAAEVDEEDISIVKPGQDVLISADAFPGQVFQGKVLSITPKGDAVSRSYRVRIAPDINAAPLMIGMTAETNIIIRQKTDALLVPASAVRDGFLWVAAHGRVEKRAVETGVHSPKAIEIIKGLSVNDIVVIMPPDDLTDRQRVNPDLQSWETR